jgi:CRISPR-associated protein (TIGR03986 family)
VSEVVVLGWDPTTRALSFVEFNGGDGGGEMSREVSPQDVDAVSEALTGPLPALAELLVDGGEVLVERRAGEVVRCSVQAVGGPADRRVRLRVRGGGPPVELPAGSVGIDDPEFAAAAGTIGDFLLIRGVQSGRPGCWIRPGGLRGWVEERVAGRQRQLAAKAEEVAARAVEEAQRRAGERFINPYTFVPFPERVDRREPGGHHLLRGGRLSGSMTVVWDMLAPLQAPEGVSGRSVVRLPGASVKGAMRAAHETLAGGCLRVFDEGFLPSYRDQARVVDDEWTLGQVRQSTRDGQPLQVELCDEVVWVRAEQLREAMKPGRLETGSRVTLEGAPELRLERRELPESARVRAGGDWVVLITSSGARVNGKRYFAACGRLGGTKVEVTEEAWATFRQAVAGAEDVRKAAMERRSPAGSSRPADRTERVEFPKGTLVGYRTVVTGSLAEGDVLWVRRNAGDPGRVDELRLAAIWRHVGRPPEGEPGTAGDRVPSHLRPCVEPKSLCPSCRVFGSVDPRPRDADGKAEQRAYRGHVRFGDAISVREVSGEGGLAASEVDLERLMRSPLGAPRPGAGQFYLDYTDPRPAAGEEDPPTREWGSVPDRGAVRPLRGRKYYWHADPVAQSPPRHAAREHQRQSKLVTERWLAPAGTRLAQLVTFDNLSPAELGGLIATLEPDRVLPGGQPTEREFALRLGGGKPLGLGSCTATIAELRVWTAESRYGDSPAEAADPDGYVAEFVADCPAEVAATWPALAAVLDRDKVDPAWVWYPPGALWADQRDDEKTFDEPFTFFRMHSGEYLKNSSRPLLPLPDPRADDQSLPIAPRRRGGT